MTPEQLRQLINDALAGGCGVLISMGYQAWVDNINNKPSAKASRAAVAILCLVVPGLLYALTIAVGWQQFDIPTLLSVWTAAFITNQGWHGVTQLGNTPAPANPLTTQ